MSASRFILRYKLHHVLFWLLVFSLWYYLRYQDYATTMIAVEITLLKVVMLASAVYFMNYYLVPVYLYRKRYIAFFGLLLLMIGVVSCIKVYVMSIVLQQPEMLRLSGNLKKVLYENAISDFFLISAGAAVKLVFDYLLMQQRLANMTKEKAQAELDFLKSQINPHFLFNSLNAVYFLIDKQNQDARQALHKFSEMLRYQLYEAGGNKIPVEREVAYLRDYIDLQKLRMNDNCAIEFDCPENITGFSIEPLLLIPFAENAFKHVSQHAAGNYIRISIKRDNGNLVFTSANTKDDLQKQPDNTGGIGLVNVKRRLELLYPGKHELQISDDGNVYTANLKIEI